MIDRFATWLRSCWHVSVSVTVRGDITETKCRRCGKTKLVRHIESPSGFAADEAIVISDWS